MLKDKKIMQRKKVLITGGAGFVGSQLVRYLLGMGDYDIVVFDRLIHHKQQNYEKQVIYCKGNMLSKKDVSKVFQKYGPFVTVYHLASAMPNKQVPDNLLWQTNVYGTLNMISEAVRNKTKSFIFTSSNVTYGIPKKLPVTEETPLVPLEMYGKSKVQAEKELAKFKNDISIQIFRCPVIVGVGRLGLQAILFEFIEENRRAYVLGKGSNKYQFADVIDVCTALEKASRIDGFEIYNIGADEVLSLKELYQKVINFAKSTSKVISIPMVPSLMILSILDKMNISPLGVYQYNMMGRSIYADTKKIKTKLGWKPTKTNADTFIDNYKWYKANKGNFKEIGSGEFSSNRSLPKMGILKLIKIFS